MSKFVVCNKNSIVQYTFPKIDPMRPDIPIDQLYSTDFLESCIQVEDEVEVHDGWKYENGIFVPVEYVPAPITLADHRAAALRRLEGCCSAAIYAGCDITCSEARGKKHYSFPEEAQRAVSLMMQGVSAGVTSFSYKADDESYNVYTVDEVRALFTAMGNWITANTKYKEALVDWIQAEEDMPTLNTIHYGSTLPEARMNALVAYLTSLGIDVTAFAASLAA